MPDLSTVTLNSPTPVFDQLARELVEPAPAEFAPVARVNASWTRELLALADDLLARWPGGGDRAASFLTFLVLTLAYTCLVVGVVLAAR